MINLSMKLALTAAAVAAVAAPTAQAAPPPTSPDGRGYEMITPPGGDSKTPRQGALVSDDGTRVAFLWGAPLPEANSGFLSNVAYGAQRTASGWGLEQLVDLGPGMAVPDPTVLDANTQAGLFFTGTQSHPGGLWLRTADGTLEQWLAAPEKIGPPAEAWEFSGGASDLSRAYILSKNKLTADALLNQTNIYEVTAQGVTLVSKLPNGTSAAMNVGRRGSQHTPDAVARDGKTVALTETAGTPSVYVHVEGEPTVEASASKLAVPHSAQPAIFDGMSDDGRLVVFTSAEQLTNDAQTDGDTTNEVYAYDVQADALRVLTPGFSDPPQVQGVVDVSQDARRVYYVANSALPGSPAADGEPNLYRFDADTGTVKFIATLVSNDVRLWSEAVSQLDSLAYHTATGDGRVLAFFATASVTGPENVGTDGTPHLALYVYDDDTGVVSCASCGPRGSHLSYGATFAQSSTVPLAADASDYPWYGGNNTGITRVRSMSADGRRVFFVTREALAPADVNGRADVYLFQDGRPVLVSPGNAPYDALYQGSSASGDDVVFSTDQPLVAADRDTLTDLYDARVGGGFPEPDDDSVVACSGDICQGPPAPAVVVPQPASLTFSGPPTVDQPRVVKPAPPVGKVRVTSRRVKGKTVVLSVRAPSAGRISVSGTRVRTVRRSAKRVATYSIRVSLTASARRSLARHRRLRVALRVGFVPVAGKASSTTVVVTVKG